MKYPDAKTLLAYQMRGSICIVLLIITGFFGHSVHNLNSDHEENLVNLEKETYQRQNLVSRAKSPRQRAIYPI